MRIKNLKYFLLFFVVAVGFFAFNASVNAQATGTTGGVTIELPNPLEAKNFQELLDRILSVLLIIATPVFVVFIMIAGLLYVVGGSNPQRRQTAFNMIKYGVIGYMIIIMARLLLNIVGGLLGIKPG